MKALLHKKKKKKISRILGKNSENINMVHLVILWSMCCQGKLLILNFIVLAVFQCEFSPPG